ncbi:hypothetical protein D3C75_891620 [compost metagenome]
MVTAFHDFESSTNGCIVQRAGHLANAASDTRNELAVYNDRGLAKAVVVFGCIDNGGIVENSVGRQNQAVDAAGCSIDIVNAALWASKK